MKKYVQNSENFHPAEIAFAANGKVLYRKLLSESSQIKYNPQWVNRNTKCPLAVLRFVSTNGNCYCPLNGLLIEWNLIFLVVHLFNIVQNEKYAPFPGTVNRFDGNDYPYGKQNLASYDLHKTNFNWFLILCEKSFPLTAFFLVLVDRKKNPVNILSINITN